MNNLFNCARWKFAVAEGMKNLRLLWILLISIICSIAYPQNNTNKVLKYQRVRVVVMQGKNGSFLEIKNMRCSSIYFDSSFFDFQFTCNKEFINNFGSAYHGTMQIKHIQRLKPFKSISIKLFNEYKPCVNLKLEGRIFWILKKDMDSYLSFRRKEDENYNGELYTDLIDFDAARISVKMVSNYIEWGWW